MVSKLKAGKPIGKSSTNTKQNQGTNTTTATSTAPASNQTNASNNGNGKANGKNKTSTGKSSHPGQGLIHRSDRANEVAQNTFKNPNLINAGEGDTGGDTGTGDTGGDTGTDTGTGDTGGDTGTGDTTGTLADIAYDFTGGAEFLYYYHPDHLGSTGFVTDKKGELYEHIEYFPFGETWIQEATSNWKVPYMYTAKELDEDTQLYYYGARYYDPRTSVWQSADPILGKYLPTGDKEQDQNLAGMGGVFNSRNLGMYGYAGLNPVLLKDPDGREVILKFTTTPGSTKEILRTETGGQGQTYTASTYKANVYFTMDKKQVLVGSADVTRNAYARSERGTTNPGTTPTLPLNDVTFSGSSDSIGKIALDPTDVIKNIKSEGPFIDSDGTPRFGIASHKSGGCSMGCSTAKRATRVKLGDLLNKAAINDSVLNGKADPSGWKGISDSLDYLNDGNFKVIHEAFDNYNYED